MVRYTVFYWKAEYMMGMSMPDMFCLPALGRSHVELMKKEARDLEELFSKMQGDEWSPNGEARELIFNKGLSHTSMSVGDVARNDDTGEYKICWGKGWKTLPREDRPLTVFPGMAEIAQQIRRSQEEQMRGNGPINGNFVVRMDA